MELKCKNCQKVLKGRWKNFCSRKCGSLYFVKTHHKETDLEKKFRIWLESNGIVFETQKSISSISVPDFVVGNVIFFMDGEYWHDRPRRRYLDSRINARLTKLGYTVKRYKGNDIIHNFETVTEDAIKTLNEAGVCCNIKDINK